jgi:4-amino-4-deoxy-L-arabinose transferase-like glycosyltransferase
VPAGDLKVSLPPAAPEFIRPDGHGPTPAAIPARLTNKIFEQRLRITIFALNGMAVFCAGLLIQICLIRYAHQSRITSYVIQTIASVQLNFLLSRYITWRDRDAGFFHSLTRFNAQQFLITGLGMAAYAGLERIHVDYILANIVVTGTLAPASFLGSHNWSIIQRATNRQLSLPGNWPLLVILLLQTGLSLRLIWSDTVFPDEALYLWAGHQEWNHWLHGAPIPAFQTYFSGAPVVYPPVGALADAAGGLAGARMLSLFFVLISTCLLYAIASRCFGRMAGFFSAGIFAGIAATQFLSAFATYDALALLLLCLAMWTGVRAAYSTSPGGSVLLWLSCGLFLVTATATKYAAGLFIPVVVASAALLSWWQGGRRKGLQSVAVVTTSLAVLMAAALLAGGHPYWEGITSTTLTRQPGTSAPRFLLFVSGKWEGALIVLAVIGALTVVFTIQNRAAKLLAWVLAGATLLVPVEQARIDTYTSLFKHIGYGAWFGAIVAGYGLASLPRAVPTRKRLEALRVSVITAAVVAIPSLPWAASHYGWPNTTPVIPVIKSVLASSHGPVLADDRGNVLDYYLPALLRSRTMAGTFFFSFNDPTSGRHLTKKPAYAAAIRHRYFSVVYLEFWDSTVPDQWVRSDIEKYGGYTLVKKIPYAATGQHGEAMIWIRKGAQP